MIDFSKKIKTRDGAKVRIYSTDVAGNHSPYPIHGAVRHETGWSQEGWTAEGHYLPGEPGSSNHRESGSDLVNPPKSAYCNVYQRGGRDATWLDASMVVHPTRRSADAGATDGHGDIDEDRIACIKFTAGQYDD